MQMPSSPKSHGSGVSGAPETELTEVMKWPHTLPSSLPAPGYASLPEHPSRPNR